MTETRPVMLTALGTMSGTSADGVDVALIETDGRTVRRRGPTFGLSYTIDERATIHAAADGLAAGRLLAEGSEVAAATEIVTRRHIEAIAGFFNAHGIDAAAVDVVGLHGQTLFHDPRRGISLQVGDAAAIARRFNVTVAHDFRSADIRGGGEGAPLAPLYHEALFSRADGRPVVLVNIGGVSNVSWIGPGGPATGFDVGPGNAPLDAWVKCHTGAPYDADGRLALAGRADEGRVAAFLGHPFFRRKPPKSLDRAEILALPEGLGLEDGAATLAEMIAAGIAASAEHLPGEAREAAAWIVVGGGARNPAILAALARRVFAPVTTSTALSIDADFVEAELFAYLAARRVNALPSAMPREGGRMAEVLLGDLAGP